MNIEGTTNLSPLHKAGKFIGIVLAVVLPLFAAYLVAMFVVGALGQNHEVTWEDCVVSEVEKKNKYRGQHTYWVYSSCGDFITRNDPMYGHFSDLGETIMPGSTYTFKTRGVDARWLAQTPNIIEAALQD